ncbi:MAG: D-alanine--D-alanine ligase [Deltaproteobacteria bacterium]|nr:D-alanine--D-alanine ligase [Deltaproteobacteria bacterium]MBW2395976.1 D-alanine--D-alanine ligase [Deltaproteobacteria bacterium]
MARAWRLRHPGRIVTALRVGIVFEKLGEVPGQGPAPDADAEFEPEETIALLEEALSAAGAEPVRLGGPRDLLAHSPAVDAALNIAEGERGRNREAWAPVLLEMAGVPCLGSDALTLSLSLDKAWAKDIVRMAGVPVVEQLSLASAEEAKKADTPWPYPLFVKPRWEGTAKGITAASKVRDRGELAAAVDRVARLYDQPALVEPFLPGAEYTVTIVGHAPPRALPVLQRALEAETGIGLHALDRASVVTPAEGWGHHTPGELEPALEEVLARHALAAFDALRCRDFARADFRLDAAGEPRFLEINPLPTFAPDGSFGVLAELEGRPVAQLLGEVFREGLVRLGLL